MPPHTELTFALTACISVASISRTSFLAGHCSSMATPSLHGERAVCMSWPHLHTGMESIFGLKSHPVRRQTQAFRPFQDGVLSYILAPLTLRPGDQAWGPDLNRRRGGPQQSTESTAHEDLPSSSARAGSAMLAEVILISHGIIHRGLRVIRRSSSGQSFAGHAQSWSKGHPAQVLSSETANIVPGNSLPLRLGPNWALAHGEAMKRFHAERL